MARTTKKKTVANKAKRSAAVADVVKPAVSVQTAKLTAEHGYLHIGADGKPDESNPVSKLMSAFRAASDMVRAAGATGISVSQLIANCEASYGPCAGKIRQTVRVWTQLEDGKRIGTDHSDYRKNGLGEIVNGKLRFKSDRYPRHNHTTLTATETVVLAKNAKPAKKS